MARTLAERGDVLPLLGEVFRTYGFEGASLARITEGTRLGKGSIYHFFPGGKDEMAEAVLADIDTWFRDQVFTPLRAADADAAHAGMVRMFRAVEAYFLSGRKICLIGVFALGQERDRFAVRVRGYFEEWIGALACALERAGRDAASAHALSEDIVAGIQGALVLARAADQPELFMRAVARLEARLR